MRLKRADVEALGLLHESLPIENEASRGPFHVALSLPKDSVKQLVTIYAFEAGPKNS